VGAIVSRPRFVDARLEALAESAGARSLLTHGLRVPLDEDRFAARMGSAPVNARVSWKAPALRRVPDAFFLARAQRMIDAYAARGVVLPPFPQLDKLVPCASLPLASRPRAAVAPGAPTSALCAVPYARMSDAELEAALGAFPDHPAVDAETAGAFSRGELIPAARAENGTLIGVRGLPAVPLNYRVADIQASSLRVDCPV
jgi:hypothetical protein